MNALTGRLVAAFLLLAAVAARAQTGGLERATPESQGLSSAAVMAYFKGLMDWPGAEIHGVVVVRHGRVVAELYPRPFARTGLHTMYSVSKTFTAAAVGLAIAENRLRLDDRVAPYFAGQMPERVSPELAAMTVRDLLTMQSGMRPDTRLRDRTRQWTRQWLAAEAAAPGQRFAYDSMCSYLLSAIVQKTTGRKLLDYLAARLFAPLGIARADWEESPEGYNTGGWGLRLTPESMARFGQLLLEGGRWRGRQVLPAAWTAEMMKPQTAAGADYGYHLWICPESPGAVRADGSLGQYIFVVPEADLVVALTQCCTSALGRQRQLLWDVLVPACRGQALPDGRETAALGRFVAEASLPLPEGAAVGPMPARLRLDGRELLLPDNELKWKSLRLQFAASGLTLHVRKADGTQLAVPAAHGRWAEGRSTAWPPYSVTALDRFKGLDRQFTTAAAYAWTGAGELTLKIHFTNFGSSVALTFGAPSAGGVKIALRPNYAARTLHFSLKK